MSFGNPSELLGSLGWLSIAILFILSIFSMVSWGIIAYKAWRFRKISKQEEQFLHSYERHPLNQPSLTHEAQSLLLSPSASVYLGVMDRVPQIPDESAPRHDYDDASADTRQPYVEKVANYIIQSQINQQEAYLPFLATTGNLTPFIGLLGTVLGIINAFGEIGVQGSASIAAVAPGVSEALIATAAGLFAAIPAVMAYNYFLAQIRKIAFRVEAFSIEFLHAVEESGKSVNEKEVEMA